MMVYFELRPALARLDFEARGKLFTAMLDYAELGVMPELDGMTALCFDLVRPKLDRDAERYEQQRLHSLYMVYCRSTPEKERMSESEFIASLTVTNSNNQLPTTATTSTTAGEATITSTRETTESTARNGERTGKGTGEGMRGRERENPCAGQYSQEDMAAALRLIELEKKRSGRA